MGRRPVAIVTGASSGIGEATAVALAEGRYAVALTARREERLQALRDRLEAGSTGREAGGVLAFAADVTDRDAVSQVVDACVERWGRVDVLVNSAGVMPLSPFSKVRVDDWERTIDVNLKGALFFIAAVLPIFLRQGSGHIINISSLASRRPFPTGGIYSATKFALRAISDALRLELSSSTGIRVTDMEPGVVATEMIEMIEDADARESFQAFWKEHKALEPADVARGVLFAVQSPSHVNVNEILMRPTEQRT